MKKGISFIYTVGFSLLFFLLFPFCLYQFFVLGKYRTNWRQRLGFVKAQYRRKEGPLIWIHACSVGEVRAVSHLAKYWHTRDPTLQLIISTTTETGFAEAKRSLPFANEHLYLPIDFPWAIRPLVRQRNPTLVVCTESDFWYHFLTEAKRGGAKIVLVNGKISERSTQRFGRLPRFSGQLFHLFDLLCVQDETYAARFSRLGISMEKIHVVPNLKFDVPPPEINEEMKRRWREEWGIDPTDRMITVGSTHAGEEKGILEALRSLKNEDPLLRFFLVPRHPERSAEVQRILVAGGWTYRSLSQMEKSPAKVDVILVDTMGRLLPCYVLSQLAVVGGSFVPGIGGHNVLEPCFFGVPVVFGPYMEGQEEMRQWTLRCETGTEASLETLPRILRDLLSQKSDSREKCREMRQQMQGSVAKTADLIDRMDQEKVPPAKKNFF